MGETVQALPAIPGYRVLKEIGSGGMAKVYLAQREREDGVPVAIKVMHAPPGADREWAARFQRETATLTQFDHPNIVRVHQVGQSGGAGFMVMEYLDHGDLTTWIRQGLQPQDALRILRALALALGYAHERGIIHRDVKPDNVLFRADGTPVLTDFGIARPRRSHSRLTPVGMAIGTPRYMSPEQHRGQDVDARSDIYALGIILYEMLTRQVPFDGQDTMTIGIKHVSEIVPRLPATLARYQRLLEHLLAKNPKDRMGKTDTLVKAIDLLLANPEPAPKKAIAADTARQRGLDIQSKETKTGFLKKARDIAITIGAEDYAGLQLQFGKALEALQEWHRDAGKKARHVVLEIYVHPWVLAMTRELVSKTLHQEDFAFLAQLQATVRVHDLDGTLEEEYVVGAGTAG